MVINLLPCSATNPSSFDVQFYINDLTRPDISTFTEIGKLAYHQNENSPFIVDVRKVTDGLLIRGRYRTLTVAVFGVVVGNVVPVVTEEKAEEKFKKGQENKDDDENILGDKRQEVIDAIMQRLEVRGVGKNETPFSPDVVRKSFKSPSTSDIDSPVTEKVSKQSPIDSIQATPTDFDDLSASNFSDVKTPRSPINIADDISLESEGTKLSSLIPAADDLSAENISPGNSILEDEVDSGGNELDEATVEDDVAEAISSEDDFEDFVEEHAEPIEEIVTLQPLPLAREQDDEDLDPISSDEEDIEPIEIDYNDKSDYLKMFDVESLELSPLTFFSRFKKNGEGTQEDDMKKFLYLTSSVSDFKEDLNSREKWVEIMETAVISFDSKSLTLESANILIDWLSSALDLDFALQQLQPPMKVRQIKAGIRLMTYVFSSSPEIVQKVISSGHVRLLVELYKKESLALPIKLLILRAFHSLANSKVGMNCIMDYKINLQEDEQKTVYQWLLENTMATNSSRILSTIAAFLKKCNLYQSIAKFGVVSSESEIIKLLRDIRSLFAISETFMKQPIRILPTEKIFEVINIDEDCGTFFDWLQELNFLQAINEHLSFWNYPVKEEIINLFLDILRSPKGVHFLLQDRKNVYLTNTILSIISTLDKRLHSQIAQFLHVTTLLDKVVSSIYCRDGHVDASDPKAAVWLHSLFMSLFTWQGRVSVINLLKDDDHLSQVIKILKVVSNRLGDEEIIFEYFSRILVDYIRFQDDGMIQVIQYHGNDLMELSRMKDKPVFACLSSFVSNFITIVPFNYCPSNFQVLSNILKRGVEQDLRTSLVSLPSIPPQVLTCLRILNQVCIPPNAETLQNEDIPKQLKYNYGRAQTYSSDCFSYIVLLLNRITNNHLAIPHISLFTDSSYYSVLSAFKLSTVLVSSVIHTLIHIRDISFQDVSVIQPLLKVNCLLSHIPDDHDSKGDVEFISDTIIETLSMFCKLPNNESLDDSMVLKSIWTKSIKEILLFVFSSPVAMKSGLSVLGQLLPDKLQNHGLNSHDEIMMNNLRKLWVVHLIPFKDQIESLGSCFCCPSEANLRNEVIMVLTKISDLSPDTSMIVVQSFMASLSAVRFKRPQLQGYLGLLVHLLQDWSFTVTFIYLIRLESVKKESNFLHDLLLLSNPHDAAILMVGFNIAQYEK